MSLQDITARAGVLLKQIDGVLSTPDVSNYGYVDEFKQLKDRVAEVRAESLRPARIGLVGGFSSGKTRTLEALLGLAGQLPVSESPSTGNIVELRMVRDEGVVETCLQNWRVKMMTEEDANGILRKLLDKARELCFLEDESLVAEMGANINPKAPWGGAAEFAKSTHPKALANKLKSVCFEICRLERVYNGGRRFIERKEGDQDGYDISLEQARNLMTLNYDPMDVSKPLADFDFSLDSIPDTAELSSLSGESLSKLFALVKKIEVEVHATPAVFDRFVSGGMQEFIFVDCPGYGADTSSVRDQALCEVELKNVDCIVVLLSARTPGNSLEFVDSANRTWKETVGDRMVAVVSRFDEIPFNDGGGKQLLSTLASDNAVTEEKVLSTFAGTLGTLWKFAERTASSDKKQICFFSAMAYIDSMLNRTPPISLGSDAFLDQSIRPVGATERSWRESCRQWKELGDAVLTKLASAPNDKEGSLGSILKDFGNDGGGTRLIEMLCKHVKEKGATNQEVRIAPDLRKSEKLFKEMELPFREWQKSWTALPEASATSGETALDFVEVQQQINELITRVSGPYRNVFDSLMENFNFSFRPQGSTRIIPAIPLLEQTIIDTICAWPAWNALFQNTDRNGLITVVDENAAVERGIPLTSDFFLKTFVGNLRQLQISFKDLSIKAVQLFVEQLQEDVEKNCPMKDTDATLLRRALEHDVVRANLCSFFTATWRTEPSEKQFCHLFDGIEKWMQMKSLERKRSQAFDVFDENSPYEFYPLQRKQESVATSYARTFPWSQSLFENYQKYFHDGDRHVVTVIRMRQVILDAAIYFLKVAEADFKRSFRQAFTDRFNKLTNSLGNVTHLLSEEAARRGDEGLPGTGGGLEIQF